MSLQRITVPPSFLLQCFVFSIQVTGELDPLSFQKLCVHMHWNKSKFERNSSLVYYHIGFARKQNMQAKDVYCVMALYLGLLVMNCYDYQHAQLSFIVFPLFNWLIRLLNPREPQSLRPVYMEGGGGPQIGEVTRGGSPHLSCKRDQIKMRDYMDRRVTPLKRVTSPTWGPPPPCKPAQKNVLFAKSTQRQTVHSSLLFVRSSESTEDRALSGKGGHLAFKCTEGADIGAYTKQI